MNVIDSSGWLEYFADGPNAEFFASVIEKTDELLVPSLSLYEVFKRVLQQRDEGEALRAVAFMQQGSVIDLDSRIALSAAKISVKLGLPMADSMMLATASQHEATFWTQDADFEDMEGVRYCKK
jgi:predicted nucleic acid-binding protein